MTDKKRNENQLRLDGFKWRIVKGWRIIDSLVSIRKQKQFALEVKERKSKKKKKKQKTWGYKTEKEKTETGIK